jgi:ribosomal protein S18 acetylase RimI-like enzyme
LGIGDSTIFEACWQATLTVRLFAGIVACMARRIRTVIRAFDGSRADAKGLLTVERSAFNECPYDTEQVRVMLTEGPQRAWLAVGGAGVVGFVIAFPTCGLQGTRWEIDLLAVRPEWRGRGLATRLIRAAADHGTALTRQARAVVATDNNASMRAFTRAGFRVEPGMCRLLIYRAEGLVPRGGITPRSLLARGVTVREASSIGDIQEWLPELPVLDDQADLTLLLAEQDGQPVGYAELIKVQTLLYRGVWIESLEAPKRTVRETLVHQALNYAVVAGLDEIGAVVPERNWALGDSLLAGGFRSLGEFHWLVADLPLPNPTVPPPTTEKIAASHV